MPDQLGGPDRARALAGGDEAHRRSGRVDPLRPGLGPARPLILLGLAAGACYLLGVMLWPFLPAIVTSAVLAVLVLPAFRRFRRRFRRTGPAALLATIAIFFLGLIPALGLSLLLMEEVRTGVEWMSTDGAGLLAPSGTVAGWMEHVAGVLGLPHADLMGMLSAQAEAIVGMLATRTLRLFTGLGGWLLQGGVALFTLYYLLRDGDALIAYAKWVLPLDSDTTDGLFADAREVMHATVFGSLVVALVQGTLGGLAFWVLGLPAPVVWGSVMGMLSILPAVGPWFVWIPATVLLLFGGHVVRAVLLAAIGTLLISTIDNVLRALLVSGRAHMHPLIVFFSVLGGLFVFGAAGVFIGPVVFSLALAGLRIARGAIEPEPRPV